jgi:hypothetical protein
MIGSLGSNTYFGPSGPASTGPAPLAPAGALPMGGNALSAIPPEVLAMLRQRMQGMNPDQQASFLNQAMQQIPQLRQAVQGLMSPQNPNVVTPNRIPNGDLVSASMPSGVVKDPNVAMMGQPPAPTSAPLESLNPAVGQGGPGAPGGMIPPPDGGAGDGLNRGMQKRLAAGKRLPPGQSRRAGGGRFNQGMQVGAPDAGMQTGAPAAPQLGPANVGITDWRTSRMGMRQG